MGTHRPKGERQGKGSAWARAGASETKQNRPKPGEVWQVRFTSGGCIRFIVVARNDKVQNLWTIFLTSGKVLNYFNMNDASVSWFAS